MSKSSRQEQLEHNCLDCLSFSLFALLCRVPFSSSLWSHEYVYVLQDIPAQFVQEHGDKFQETVLLKERWYGRVCALKVRIDHSKHRNKQKVVIGCGWSQFAKDNGLEVGDELVFCNVAMSKFVVHIFGQDGNPKNRRLLPPDNSTTMNSSCDEIAPGHLNALNVGAEEDHVEPVIKELNPDANFSNQIKRIKNPKALVNNDIVYPRMTTEFSLTLRRKIDSLVTGFQCPHFVKRIKNANIRSEGSVQLVRNKLNHRFILQFNGKWFAMIFHLLFCVQYELILSTCGACLEVTFQY